MSDLISRSELISRIESEYREYGEDYDAEQILGDIEDMQTAYDIDKVVEELNELDVTAIKRYEGGTFGNYKGTDYYIKKSDAIEIVKQGGDANDVCEWIEYDYRTICPKNHDANNPYWRIPDNTDKLKYCPYCGKKIKVVE